MVILNLRPASLRSALELDFGIAHISELVLRVEGCWLKIEIHVEFLNQIWDSLGERLQTIQNRMLDVLQSKLIQAIQDLDRVTVLEAYGSHMEANDKIKTKRLKFVIALGDNLIKNVEQLESWHARFDPSWWLLLRLKSHSIDKELTSEITSRAGSLTTLKTLRNELAAQETKRDSAPFEFLEENALVDDHEIIPYTKSTLACLEGS
ncbi:hypothetical protein OEA41_004013 [Lepraria neglecta]|uniref:Uncharacterized protein n=1 Tax=Lepraria neglecta TaxID=209136 RepID=A0AAD9Z5C1_9LECA|nr:hypothetical protein OEA41_004013 [Lepraria neglecta]